MPSISTTRASTTMGPYQVIVSDISDVFAHHQGAPHPSQSCKRGTVWEHYVLGSSKKYSPEGCLGRKRGYRRRVDRRRPQGAHPYISCIRMFSAHAFAGSDVEEPGVDLLRQIRLEDVGHKPCSHLRLPGMQRMRFHWNHQVGSTDRPCLSDV
jgi:hypothetical protein